MFTLAAKSAFRLAPALLLAAVSAFSQSLPAAKEWAGMTPAERQAWINLKAAWNADSAGPEIQQLNQTALAAAAAGDHAASIRSVSHAITLLRGQDWTPQRAFTAAMTADLDRAVVGTGETFKVHLGQLFTLDQPLKGSFKVALSLQISRTEETNLGFFDVANPDLAGTPKDIETAAPATPCANCRVIVAIGDPSIRRALPIRIQAGLGDLRKRIAAADERVKALAAKGTAAEELAPIQYRLSLLDTAAFNEADAALSLLESGSKPWASRHGDFRMAYRSAVDDTLQPYRLFIPASYDGSKPFPVILALHGAGRDENFYFDSVQDGQIKTYAEKRGYIVACPRGRDPLSLFVGTGEQDVSDVLASVRKFFKVDPARVYLAGYDTGGAAVWFLARTRAGVFAAVAASAPAAFFVTAADMAELKTLPQLVVQGDQDRQVPVKQTLAFADAARKAGAQVRYLEVSGAAHADLAAAGLSDMFDWFDAHRATP